MTAGPDALGRTYIERGQVVTLELPYSEVCMHMGVAGQVMQVRLTPGPHPMAQLIRDGRPFSFPVTTGEAGIYRDANGYYAYAAQEGRS